MTQGIETPITSYTTSSAVLQYNFSFTAPTDEIEVYLDNVLIATYSAVSNYPSANGFIVLNSAPANGQTLDIKRATDLDQQQAYSAGGGFTAASHELALDRAVRMIQDLFAFVSGTIATVAAAVTYENLDANGDIGDTAGKVPDGASVQADIAAGDAAHAALANPHTSSATKTSVTAVQDNLDTHTGATNPHSISALTVGLSNADNTSDVNKPVSTAQASAIGVVQADIDAHELVTTGNPHGVNAADVGLGSVDNESLVTHKNSTDHDTHNDARYKEVADVESILLGGTGATSASAARTALSVPEFTAGTWSPVAGDYTGFSSGNEPVLTFKWDIIESIIFLTITVSGAGISDGTLFYIDNPPSAIVPNSSIDAVVTSYVDNTAGQFFGRIQLDHVAEQLRFWPNSGVWTASGGKGVVLGVTITYSLVN